MMYFGMCQRLGWNIVRWKSNANNIILLDIFNTLTFSVVVTSLRFLNDFCFRCNAARIQCRLCFRSGRRAWFYWSGLRHSLCTLNSCCNSLRRCGVYVRVCVCVLAVLGVTGLAVGPDRRITPLTFRFRHERWSFSRSRDRFHIFIWHLIPFSSLPVCLPSSLSCLGCSIYQDCNEIGEERSLSYLWHWYCYLYKTGTTGLHEMILI